MLEALMGVAQGRTTIIVSRALGISALADRVVVLDGGRIVEEGRPGEPLTVVYCFRVDPSPGFTYYESPTGRPIGRSIAMLLQAGTSHFRRKRLRARRLQRCCPLPKRRHRLVPPRYGRLPQLAPRPVGLLS